MHVWIDAFVLDVWIYIICSRQWSWLLYRVSRSNSARPLKDPWREAGFKGWPLPGGREIRQKKIQQPICQQMLTPSPSANSWTSVPSSSMGPDSLRQWMHRCRWEVIWGCGCGEAGLTCRVTCLFPPEGRLLEFPLLGACWAQPLISRTGSFN